MNRAFSNFSRAGARDLQDELGAHGIRFARLVFPNYGGALRTIITGNKCHATGMYPSNKTQSGQVWEGFPELHQIYESEIDHDVVDYQTQPLRVEFVAEGRKHTYLADHGRTFRNGAIEIVEVKRRADDLGCPDYRRRLKRVEIILAMKGWTFRVAYLHRTEIPLVRLQNLKLIQSRRFAAVTEEQTELIWQLRRHGAEVLEWGELVDMLSADGSVHAEAVLHALIAQGLLAIDLDCAITRRSLVRLIPPIRRQPSSFRQACA